MSYGVKKQSFADTDNSNKVHNDLDSLTYWVIRIFCTFMSISVPSLKSRSLESLIRHKASKAMKPWRHSKGLRLEVLFSSVICCANCGRPTYRPNGLLTNQSTWLKQYVQPSFKEGIKVYCHCLNFYLCVYLHITSFFVVLLVLELPVLIKYVTCVWQSPIHVSSGWSGVTNPRRCVRPTGTEMHWSRTNNK